eukprot:1712622-Rhodomonas_salina.2
MAVRRSRARCSTRTRPSAGSGGTGPTSSQPRLLNSAARSNAEKKKRKGITLALAQTVYWKKPISCSGLTVWCGSCHTVPTRRTHPSTNARARSGGAGGAGAGAGGHEGESSYGPMRKILWLYACDTMALEVWCENTSSMTLGV